MVFGRGRLEPAALKGLSTRCEPSTACFAPRSSRRREGDGSELFAWPSAHGAGQAQVGHRSFHCASGYFDALAVEVSHTFRAP
jgi:hypothetical protein